MNKDELIKRIAKLEFLNDQLVAELTYLDDLMKKVGFSEGLISLKETAKDLYTKEIQDRQETDEHRPAA